MTSPRRQSSRRSPPSAESLSTDSILQSISDGVFTVDSSFRITSFNRAATEITGVLPRDALQQRCSDVFRASMCEGSCALRRTLETGTPVVNRAAFIIDASGARIPISVSTAVLLNPHGRVIGGAETFRDLRAVEELRKDIAGHFELGEFATRSPLVRRVLDVLPRVAESHCTVLVRGETGTGKELIARAIHALSPRRLAPFVAVNCGALPDNLLESELFGHVAGAFTGAVANRMGRFALAEGGTLFLDEIGEVSPALQIRLLRVLQERTYEPLGTSKPVPANVRILAATHRDLDSLVESGQFRQDLYYRIQVVSLELPPLRERREDIPLLVERYLDRLNATHDKHIACVSPDVLSLLLAHPFPGNVRELHNILEHAFVLCATERIEVRHLPSSLLPPRQTRRPGNALRDAVGDAESSSICEALRRNGNNRAATAEELGLHRTTLLRKLRRLGIVPKGPDGRARRRARHR